ncbi:hypothetical protein [Streptomyces sp. SID5910]|uniref:hypothetical protein n=1 Tax=Streptomyces sp. SID5910 TaxID=2690312 RepID=UPI001367FBC7|nr:hypothetical protein [Streptomyces sp. SID5910]MYR41726.1 hypothetical protein [Streptomyces sp. SID5910]
MKHVPFFRWVVAVGLLLVGCAVGLYMAAPEYPELKQVELTVLREAPDGTCTVRWTDPFGAGERAAAHLCDADRDPLLKAPEYEPGTGLGWDTGFVRADGPRRGDLFSSQEYDDFDRSAGLTDALAAGGLLMTLVGVVGGNVRSLIRLSGASPAVVRRAEELREAALRVARDHARAVEAVRGAWEPLHQDLVRERLGAMPVARLRRTAGRRLPARELEKHGVRSVRDVLDTGAWGLAQACGTGRRTAETVWDAARRTADAVSADTTVRLDAGRPGPRTVALLNALRVLVEAGPEARTVAEAGRDLAAGLERRLADAAPAAGWRRLLDAGAEERRRAVTAVAGLRGLLDEAGRAGVRARFAQVSVDLLRGADADAEGLAARTDFEARPAAYYGLLAEIATPPGRE